LSAGQSRPPAEPIYSLVTLFFRRPSGSICKKGRKVKMAPKKKAASASKSSRENGQKYKERKMKRRFSFGQIL